MQTYKVTVDNNGTITWYLNGKLHREDGPAIEWLDGSKSWYLNGKRHREDGPAIEYSNGDKEWCLNGKCHREDGPAIEYSDGDKAWYIDGIEYTEATFKAKTIDCNGKIVEVDGRKYRLQAI